jgi:prevent-host-death family protein
LLAKFAVAILANCDIILGIIKKLVEEVFAMIVTSTDVQNNFGKYLEMTANGEVIITKNGVPVARLLSTKDTVSFLSDRLVGLIPSDVDEDLAKTERLAKQ